MGAIPDEEEAVLARLDAAFAEQKVALSARQVAVVRAWQRTDREYEAIQAVTRGQSNLGSRSVPLGQAVEMQQTLDDAVRTGRLAFALSVYRGVRSVRRTFGVDDPDAVAHRPTLFRGFTAASVFRRVALEEFTTPTGALMEIALPAGTPALWVAGVGSARLRRQGELLLPDRLWMRVVDRRVVEGLATFAMEVLPR